MDNTETLKVRLYTVREFAGLFGVSYWTIRYDTRRHHLRK